VECLVGCGSFPLTVDHGRMYTTSSLRRETGTCVFASAGLDITAAFLGHTLPVSQEHYTDYIINKDIKAILDTKLETQCDRLYLTRYLTPRPPIAISIEKGVSFSHTLLMIDILGPTSATNTRAASTSRVRMGYGLWGISRQG
jgi:hypothetical protein